MYPSSKSKSKDKKAGKEAPKNSLKPLGHVNTSSATPSSGYNPVLKTFHTFESGPVPSASPLHVNGCFRNIDDTDDHNGSSSGTGVEYDSISNNGSWSGDSEDHKEKSSQQLTCQDIIPGADNDKREKIRQKNEKKHQRQKERRAQELHERCCGFLMSRKLEALAQQLVAMGFSKEPATMALIMNEGRLEESVSWLFEGGDEKKFKNYIAGIRSMKIDISEELARITDMEIRYKASKQQVERAVVCCEGDIDRAEKAIMILKEDPPAVPSKPDENGDPPTVAISEPAVAISQNSLRMQPKSTSATTVQQERDDKDFNHTKVPATVGSSADPAAKSLQVLKKIPPKADSAKPQQIAVLAEKRWVSAGSDPSASFSLASHSLPSPTPTKMDVRYAGVGNDLKILQLGSVKEPVIVMQRPQSINANQAPSAGSSSSPPGPMDMSWYPSYVEPVKPHGFVPSVTVPNNVSLNQLYGRHQYQSSQQQFMSSNGPMESSGTKRVSGGLWVRGGSPALAVPSSLGLFSSNVTSGASGTSSQVDWSTGSSMLQFDYTNVDWSLDSGSVLPKPDSLWTGANYNQNIQPHDAYGGVLTSIRRPGLSNGNAAAMDGRSPNYSTGYLEWISPFEEKDLLSLPRQVISSPTL
ncbi:uncharacterized protein LOC121740942 [Salvia splendens]|nr:uncharacterized protein LOC121740942 [Salvia splendens]XP_041989546.1 uncharacterized protein LOC121740942 [Salvia splendens]